MFAVKTTFMLCIMISLALSLMKKNLVIGQRQKTHNFSAFHWSSHGSLVSIGSTITEKDRNKLNHRIGPKQT